MMKVVLLALVATLAVASARMLSDQQYQYEFGAYMRMHGKNYAASEVAARYAAFKDNYDYVQTQNAKFAAGESGFEVEMNKFADLTQAEFKQLYLSTFNSTRPLNTVFLPESTDDSVDWRTKNAVTPVKNQGQCGSCWSFSTTGSVEGAWAIAKGNLVSVSEQQLVDCSDAYGNQGCNGGLMDNAFKYIIHNGGIDTEADYPYTARDGTCNKQKEATHAVSIGGYQDVPHNNEAQLLAAVGKGPVSVAIEADQQGFQMYKSGVFDGPCGTQLDHGVLVVGYGTLSSKNYWIVKNSWGASWGMSGYILLVRGKGAAGQCGINMQPSYPTVTAETKKKEATKPIMAKLVLDAVSAASQYEAPPCGAGETAVQLQGIPGSYCAPSCSAVKKCPTDVPAGTTAIPECVVETQGHSTPSLCALICKPGPQAGCPPKAKCQPIQGTGVCTYPSGPTPPPPSPGPHPSPSPGPHPSPPTPPSPPSPSPQPPSPSPQPPSPSPQPPSPSPPSPSPPAPSPSAIADN